MSCFCPRLRWLTVLPVQKNFSDEDSDYLPCLLYLQFHHCKHFKDLPPNFGVKKIAHSFIQVVRRNRCKITTDFWHGQIFWHFFSKNFSRHCFGVVISELRVQNYCRFLTWPNFRATFFKLFFVNFSIRLTNNTIENCSFFKKLGLHSIFIKNGPFLAHSSYAWFILFYHDYFFVSLFFQFLAQQPTNDSIPRYTLYIII